MKIYFARGNINSNFQSSDYFHVNNCGYYSNIKTQVTLSRPEGRDDYQLIYIKSGEMEVRINDKLKIFTAGNCIFYMPHSREFYRAYSNDDFSTSYYWIHFSGTACEKIAKDLQLNKSIHHSVQSSSIMVYFEKVIYAIEHGLDETYINGLALCLLSALTPHRNRSIFAPIIERMHYDIEHKIDNTDYAKLANFSKYHFIKLFKAEFNTTPQAYLTSLKIDKCKLLLMETDLKIKDIADLTGFNDALYMSKVFKKIVGTSPSNYRHNSS